MPLQSRALKDDIALQACLTSDRDHVVPGAQGRHVAKIQQALLLLDRADIAFGEIRASTYGSTTAAAVLAFKRKRRIINYSYQTAADNIVGKMTIARLDADLLLIDTARPQRTGCGGGEGGPVSVEVGAAPTVGRLPARRRNAVLDVVFQVTDGAEQLGGVFRMGVDLLARARDLLAPHGISLRNGTFLDFIGPAVPDFDNVLSGSDATTFSIRAAAERVFPGRSHALRVIFCPFDDRPGEAKGVTCGGFAGDWHFPNFCLINVRKRNPDRGTLLHEMIHAAYPDRRLNHDLDSRSIFSEGTSRSVLPDEHAQALSISYFSSVRL